LVRPLCSLAQSLDLLLLPHCCPLPERNAVVVRLRLKCDGTCAETRFCLSAKRTHPFKSTGASVQSTTGRRGVRISGSNAGYTMFRGSVKSTGYPLHSPVSPSTSPPVRHQRTQQSEAPDHLPIYSGTSSLVPSFTVGKIVVHGGGRRVAS
jgi:hypothetical protein